MMDTMPVGVPLKKAMEILGLDKSAFYYYVNSKQIKVVEGMPAMLPALYDYQDILAVREKRAQRLQSQKAKKTPVVIPLRSAIFRRATPEDMPELANVIEKLFSRPDIERWSSWMRKNPDIGYLIRSENRVVGCGFIVPLLEEKILDILSKEVTPPTLPSEIQEYTPGVPICLYARTIGVLQDEEISMRQRRYWGSVLVRHLTEVVVNLGARGIVIEKIYGRSDYEEGARLMAGMGFTHLRTTTSHENYVIDVKTSGLEMILDYEQALIEWRQRQSGE